MALLGTGEGGLELRDWRDETRRAYATEAVENPDNTATTRTCFVMSTNTAALAGSLSRTGHDELQEPCEDLARVTVTRRTSGCSAQT
jgi:hypothetical protein